MPSSLISKSSYDPATRTLSVWFVTNGKRYGSEGVSPGTYGAFRAAFSKGRFFNRHIRPNHAFRQVADDGTTDVVGDRLRFGENLTVEEL